MTQDQILRALAAVPAAAGNSINFTLAGGASRVFGAADFPGLSAANTCSVREINANGANLSYTSLSGASGATAISSDTVLANGGTLTVTNAFTGDLIVSKVVTGDPKTNIAIYEISVACDQGGPRETFLLKDRQSRIYRNINAGTNCLVTETRSDGAVASYADNSGDNTTDGRVVIRQTQQGCVDPRPHQHRWHGPGHRPPRLRRLRHRDQQLRHHDRGPDHDGCSGHHRRPDHHGRPAVAPAPAEPVVEAPTFTG